MQGYLLDNNHVAAYFNRNADVLKRLADLPDNSQIRVSAITFGEIEAGHEMNPSTDELRREEFLRWVYEKFLPHCLPVSKDTRIYYAKIIGRIWAAKPPENKRISTEEHLVKLGVDVNDAWSVAVAWEHGFTFVTHDGMEAIKGVVNPNEVPMECWY